MKKIFYLSVHYFEISWKSMPHFTFRKRIQFLSFHVQALVALSRGFSFSYGLPPGGLIGVGVHPVTVSREVYGCESIECMCVVRFRRHTRM